MKVTGSREVYNLCKYSLSRRHEVAETFVMIMWEVWLQQSLASMANVDCSSFCFCCWDSYYPCAEHKQQPKKTKNKQSATINWHSQWGEILFLATVLSGCCYRCCCWVCFFFVCLFFAFPSYISGLHHFWVRFLRMWPFFNPAIKVVTFCLRGWCVLGVFLLPAFTRLGHERQDLLSPCD